MQEVDIEATSRCRGKKSGQGAGAGGQYKVMKPRCGSRGRRPSVGRGKEARWRCRARSGRRLRRGPGLTPGLHMSGGQGAEVAGCKLVQFVKKKEYKQQKENKIRYLYDYYKFVGKLCLVNKFPTV